MTLPSVHGATPTFSNGPTGQPRFDSYGRKVPLWDAVQIETSEKPPVEQQSSWKSMFSRKGSWSSSTSAVEKSIQYGAGSSGEQKSWLKSLNPFASRYMTRPASVDMYPSSPYVSLPSHSFGQPNLWKPITLRLPVLGSILVFTLGMIAVLEVLSYLSNGPNNEKGGGLVFAATQDELPLLGIAAYIYLPTVIAVIYSIIWSWVDLDVKRLEPWFQLSKPDGATAENSVLLSYPFDFLAFVPIRAARRKHWAVVIAGSTMMLITWAIVPLQSAIFSIGTVTRSRLSTMAMTKTLMEPKSQLSHLNSRFMIAAYGVSWLDQQLPAYSTKNYALQPFAPVDVGTSMLSTETWTSPTTMYYTNLTCSPVSFNRSSNSNSTQPWDTVSDGKTCVSRAVDILDFIDTPHFLTYAPWCNGSFLAVWAQSDPNKTYDISSMEWENITALTCTPSYHARTVTATVNATTLAVISVDTNDARQPLLLNEEKLIFNTTLFEELAGNGGLPYRSPRSRFESRVDERFGNLDSMAKVQQVQKLTMFNLTAMSTSKEHSERSFVPYALAASTLGFEGLSDPIQLQANFEKAHQVLFSAAVSHLMVPINDIDSVLTPTVLEGVRQDKPEAVVYVRAFAIAVEACLGVIALLICALWMYYRKRPSHMDSDPRTINDVMRLVRSSQNLLRGFRNYGTVTVTTKDLEKSLQGRSFRLTTDAVKGMQLQVLGGSSFDVNSKDTAIQTRSGSDGQESFTPVRPLELNYITGALLAAVVASAMAILVSFYLESVINKGLTRPSNNAIVLLILTNLIPTAFATLIEPFWVILNRLLCILQPFEDLRDGNAKPSSTVAANYTSLPPQLPVWQALKSKHYLLAMVCVVSLSTNILAVALSGLFNEEAAVVTSLSTASVTLTPNFNDAGDSIFNFQNDFTSWQSLDQYYVALAYLEGSAKLPPWVDDNYFYIPFDLPKIPDGSIANSEGGVQGFSTQTRGFGVSANCQPLLQDPSKGEYVIFNTKEDGFRNQLNVVKNVDGGTNFTCSTLMTSDDLTVFPISTKWSENATSIEWVYSMYNHLKPGDMPTIEYCAGMVLAGWVRVNGAPAKAALAANQSLEGHLESSFMACKPTIHTGMFDIDFDTTGRVRSSKLSGNLTTDISQFGHNFTNLRLRETAGDVFAPSNLASWHNSSYTQEWLNTLLAVKLNTTDVVNPSKPLPNVTDIAPHVAELYQLIFAITLSLTTDSTFNTTSTPLTIPITIQIKEQRIFMQPVMFYISAILLALQLLVALLYYTKRPRRFLPRMPLSMASIISYVAASHAVHDAPCPQGTGGNTRFGYGHYIGVDGKGHVGIERAERVVPLKSRNPHMKRRTWWRTKGDESQPRTWI